MRKQFMQKVKGRRIMAIFLSICMVFALFPTIASADDEMGTVTDCTYTYEQGSSADGTGKNGGTNETGGSEETGGTEETSGTEETVETKETEETEETEEIDKNGGKDENKICTCKTLCTEGHKNSSCPVCGRENADFADCLGEILEPEEKPEPECLCNPVIEGEGIHTNPDCPFYAVQETTAYDKVVALFNALPSADSITKETTDEEKDELIAQINAAVDALLALSDQDFAKFTAEHDDLLEAMAALQAAIVDDVPVTLEDTITTVDALNNAIKDATGTADTPTLITIDLEGITVSSGITIDAKHVKLTGGTLTRGSGFTGDMIVVKNGGSLTLEEITLDGNNISSSGTLVKANGTKNLVTAITLENGAVLENNIMSGTGGAVYLYSGGNTVKFTMNDGTICNNTAKSGGAIGDSGPWGTAVVEINGGTITGNTANGTDTDSTYGGAITNSGTLMITGGEITGNITSNGRGGGIYKTGGSKKEFTVTGGTISGNTARSGVHVGGSGNNVYVSQCTFTMGGSADIPDGLYLKLGAGDSSFYISSALENPVKIEGIYDNPAVGFVVAEGKDYTITKDDLGKISYGGSLSLVLDAVTNQIKLANPSYSITYHLTGVEASEGSTPLPETIEKGKDLMVQFVATEGYKLGDTAVTVTVGGNKIKPYQLWDFEKNCSITIKKDQITGNVVFTIAATEMSSDAQLSALTYKYASDMDYVTIPGFTADAINPTYHVTLPSSVADDAAIYIRKTKRDKNAKETTTSNIFNLTEGQGSWSVTITSENGKNTNTYTINLKKGDPVSTPTVEDSSSSGSGGSGGGSGGSNTTTARPGPLVESEIKINGTVDENGSVGAELPQSAVEDAIKKAEDEARKNGNQAGGVTLVLNISTGGVTAGSVTVNLPKTTQETILSKKIVNTVIVVDQPSIRVGMDLAAVA